MQWDVNNLHGQAIQQKLLVNDFEKQKYFFRFDEDFMKNYDENNDKRYILEVDVVYPKELQKTHSDLPFLPKKVKICECEKIWCNLYDKSNMSYI